MFLLKKKSNYMSVAFLAVFLLATNSFLYAAQSKDEVQVDGSEPELLKNAEIKKTTTKEPKKRGCTRDPSPSCSARIMCSATAVVYGNPPDAEDVDAALDAAEDIANQSLCMYYGADTTGSRSTDKGKKNSNGTSGSSSEGGRATKSSTGRTCDAYLQGVEILASEVNIQKGEARVIIGQSCDSKNAAQEAVSGSIANKNNNAAAKASGANGSNQSNGNEVKQKGPQTRSGSPESYTEKINTDF